MIFNPPVMMIEPEPVTKYTITITGTGYTTNVYHARYVIINGTTYTSAATVEVEEGTIIECYARTQSAKSYKQYSGTWVDGTSVQYGTTSTTDTITPYEYEVTGNVAVAFSGMDNGYGRIDLTTT